MSRSRITAISAISDDNSNNDKDEIKQKQTAAPRRRRGFLRTVGSTVAGIATATVFRGGGDNNTSSNNGRTIGGPSPALAMADISTSPSIRVVQMEVANLGGVPGRKGTFKIQLRPEWAPRGARRFEVC